MARRREVVPGQSYQAVETNAVWDVRDVSNDAAGILHARLVRRDDPTTVKMIAVSVLRDPRRYRPLAEDQGEV